MCPGIELVEARHKLYVEYHHKIIAAVDRCIPVTKVVSIDEMACRLMGGNARCRMRWHSRRRSSRRYGSGRAIRCVAQLAWLPTGLLAKMAPTCKNPMACLR